MNIKPECWVYSIMGWPRIIYKIIKIIPFIVIIILLFYVILCGNSAANFHDRLLDGTHDLPKAHVLPYLEDLGGVSCIDTL